MVGQRVDGESGLAVVVRATRSDDERVVRVVRDALPGERHRDVLRSDRERRRALGVERVCCLHFAEQARGAVVAQRAISRLPHCRVLNGRARYAADQDRRVDKVEALAVAVISEVSTRELKERVRRKQRHARVHLCDGRRRVRERDSVGGSP